MALSTNVARRNGSRQYYARLAVPKELQKKLRKRELWKSLGTTDPKEAKRRELVDKILRGTKSGDIPVEQPTKFEFAEGVGENMPTVSIGVAVAVPARVSEYNTLIKAADTELFRAKRLGRNRTEVAPVASRTDRKRLAAA